MLPYVHDAIVQAARENNLDPSMALAIADRESSGNVNGRAPGSSAYGLFQLLRSERNAYGGNTQDAYEQATAWSHYIKGTQAEMAKVLGRDPTGPELYLGHYFGGTRAARLVSGQVPGQTPVQAVFSPQELAVNPNIVHAGTTGALTSSILGDISRRQAKFGGAGVGDDDAGSEQPGSFDPTKYGKLVGGGEAIQPAPTAAPIATQSQPKTPDYSSLVNQQTQPMPPPMPPAMKPMAPAPYTGQQSII